jgi:replicative DNA helicase
MTTNVGHIPPVGPHMSAGVMFLGALLWCSPAEAAEVLALVLDDDMSTPALSAVLSAVRKLVDAGTPPGPTLVLDELQRVGNLKAFAERELQDAVTCGAPSMALRQFAAAVVSDAFRRRVDSAGASLSAAVAERPEAELARLVSKAMVSCLDCAARLEQLRGSVADG